MQALLPSVANRRWHVALDTTAASPGDITARSDPPKELALLARAQVDGFPGSA
ncbi:MAG TPA: hypothetical protein VK714_18060 [Myxococcota bacterium]|nr:hypothetical protein [Myxococcota bacterium]